MPSGWLSLPLGGAGGGLFTLHASLFTIFSSPRGGWEGAFLYFLKFRYFCVGVGVGIQFYEMLDASQS